MSLFTKLFFFSTLIFSLNAFAGIDGKWIGWVDWKYMGDGTRCSANLAFGETESTFTYQKGFLDCDIIIMDIPERLFNKSGEDLVLENTVAGKWGNGRFEWSERYNERTVIFVSIFVEGSHMDYTEQWIQDENTLLYDLKGRLFRRQ